MVVGVKSEPWVLPYRVRMTKNNNRVASRKHRVVVKKLY